MAYTHENIQFSESEVKYNLSNILNILIDTGSLSGAGRLQNNRRTVVPPCVNGDIAIQWEWSNFDPSQNPNP